MELVSVYVNQRKQTMYGKGAFKIDASKEFIPQMWGKSILAQLDASPFASPTADPLAGVYNDHQRELEYLQHMAQQQLGRRRKREITSYETFMDALSDYQREHDRMPTEFIVNPEVWYHLRYDLSRYNTLPIDERGMRLCGMDVEVNPEVRTYLFR